MAQFVECPECYSGEYEQYLREFTCCPPIYEIRYKCEICGKTWTEEDDPIVYADDLEDEY